MTRRGYGWFAVLLFGSLAMYTLGLIMLMTW